MSRKLQIAGDFALPLDAVTQTFAILARKRVGKTYTASVMAEEMVEKALPFVVLDPTGAWWGLRSSSDGKTAGYPVIVIGGAHGDVPLEEHSGKVIADLVVDHPGFYVVDLSATPSNAAQDRFATDFAEHFYRRKERDKSPMHLFVDEADSFAPQRPMDGQQRMLGAFEAIVRRGGIRGIGVTLITQRPAVLNKNVLTQAEILIALQMSAPQDQDALEEWIKRNGTKEQRDEMMSTLAGLQMGEAWIWSPSWLQIFKRIHIRQRTTFNSSATPKIGEKRKKRIEPARLAAVDLAKLGEQIQASVERAKENDPSLLRRQLAEARKQLKKLADEPKPLPTPKVKERPVLKEAQLARLEKIAGKLQELVSLIAPDIKAASLNSGLATLQDIVKQPGKPTGRILQQPQLRPRQTVPVNGSAEPLGKAERRILTALAQYHPESVKKRRVALLAGYAMSGGGFGNALGRCRSLEFVVGSDDLTITDAGLEAVGPVEPLPVGQELVAYWMNHSDLGNAEREILRVLSQAEGPMSKVEVAGATNSSTGGPYDPAGGGFGNALGRLRTLQLVEGDGNSLQLSQDLTAA